jgi:Domain of unknown function (DUF1707)
MEIVSDYFLTMCRLSYRHRDHRERRSERAEEAHHGAPLAVAPPSEPPLTADAGRMRASDAERERTVETLRRHAAAGRLDADELERRVEAAFAATTRADLDALQADLPGPPPATRRVERPRRGSRRTPALAAEWCVYAFVAVILLTVWALTGADGFWPAWPLGFWGAALLFKRPVPWAHAGRRVTPGRG